jgi:iron complex outermembrane receptor protein
MKLGLIATLIIGLLSGVGLVAQEQTTLKGRVIDGSDNTPIASAIVYIPETSFYVYTNDNGEFEFNNLSIGKYPLQITRLGYKTSLQQLEINDQSPSDILIKLEPRPLQTEEILVTSTPYSLIPQSKIRKKEIKEKYPRDISVFLKENSGFGAIRKGGYATDPVMRGFKNDQLNVQYDGGIKVSCACPNRMDPITTHAQAEELEKIVIIKGPYNVRYGQISGGIINLVMKRPQPTETFQVKADLEGGYESNGEGTSGRLGVSANNSFYNLYFSGATKNYGNYQNGSSLDIPSSFGLNDYSLRLGFFPIKNHLLQITWRESFARDVLHAALPMDTKKIIQKSGHLTIQQKI